MLDNPDDFAEREVEVAIHFLGLSSGFDVIDPASEAPSPLLREDVTLEGPEEEMVFQPYKATLPNLNPGEWVRLSFRLTEPVAVLVDVRSSSTSAEVQFI